jgi:putative alpha-1,2-mannosidase
VRWALGKEYGDGPDGLPGNDDGGTMSAWYLFASLGFFPRIGFSDYLVGAPIFPKATLKLPGGDLVITAKDTSAVRYVPAKVTFAGAPVTRIEHAALAKGGTLDFTLQRE